jgi:hypothetical protein
MMTAVMALAVDTSFGVPVEASAEGLAMDVDRLLSLTKALDGDDAKRLQFMQASGMNSSALEHSVPEQLFSTPESPVEGVSAVKALQLAAEQGIPIYTVTQDNIATVLPQLQLAPEVIDEIENAVNAGNVVNVSKTDINFNGWTGCGYIVMNPITGEGAYMISGGLSGAQLVEGLKIFYLSLVKGDVNSSKVGSKLIYEGLEGIYEFYTSDYFASYLSCIIGAASHDFNALVAGFVTLGWALYGIAAKKIIKRVFGFVGYAIIVVGAISYFYEKGGQCAEQPAS